MYICMDFIQLQYVYLTHLHYTTTILYVHPARLTHIQCTAIDTNPTPPLPKQLSPTPPLLWSTRPLTSSSSSPSTHSRLSWGTTISSSGPLFAWQCLRDSSLGFWRPFPSRAVSGCGWAGEQSSEWMCEVWVGGGTEQWAGVRCVGGREMK